MNLRNLKVETIKDKLHRVLWNSYHNHIKDNKVDINLVFKDVVERFISIPITVECEEYNGTDTECDTQPCPHCIDGQRTLIKVRRCTGDISIGQQVKICKKYRESNDGCKLGEAINGKRSCTGKITEPLTLADIGWGKSRLKLKKGWEVEE